MEVHVETLRPRQPFDFPWNLWRFFDTFPECALLVGPELAPLTLTGEEHFDLVILPYQVWFLAPSLPVTAFLQHPVAQSVLQNTPVVTVIGCRNMWMMAQEKMKQLLSDCGARLIDNVVLTDASPTLVTLVTTPWWLLTGRRRLRGLPPAGIDDTDVDRSERFGLALRDALHVGAERTPGPLLHGLQACTANPRLLVSERAGTRSFFLWGKLLRAAGAPGTPLRRILVLLYIVFLIVLILTVVPLSLTMQALLRPFISARLDAAKQHFEWPSGSGNARMGEYGY